jgi:histidinol-phosphate phosphatase family protein
MSLLSVGNNGNLQDTVFAKPAFIADLDGTIRYSQNGEHINGPDDVALYDHVIDGLWRYRMDGYLIFGVTNQGGVAHGYKTPDDVQAELQRMEQLAAQQSEQGWPFHQIKACYYMENGSVEEFGFRSLCRKPSYGQLAVLEDEARANGFIIDWDRSIMIGDRDEDQACAEAAGVEFHGAEEWRTAIAKVVTD